MAYNALVHQPAPARHRQVRQVKTADATVFRSEPVSFVANLAPSLFFDVLFRQAEQVGRAQQRGQQAVALPLGQRGEALDHVLRQ
ncbi:hypothetical protein PALA42_04877 [Pseudomonas aeruginosa]|nr:hypothetical protein PALA42_04877 [Pseudomonas aeruginosa]